MDTYDLLFVLNATIEPIGTQTKEDGGARAGTAGRTTAAADEAGRRVTGVGGGPWATHDDSEDSGERSERDQWQSAQWSFGWTGGASPITCGDPSAPAASRSRPGAQPGSSWAKCGSPRPAAIRRITATTRAHRRIRPRLIEFRVTGRTSRVKETAAVAARPCPPSPRRQPAAPPAGRYTAARCSRSAMSSLPAPGPSSSSR